MIFLKISSSLSCITWHWIFNNIAFCLWSDWSFQVLQIWVQIATSDQLHNNHQRCHEKRKQFLIMRWSTIKLIHFFDIRSSFLNCMSYNNNNKNNQIETEVCKIKNKNMMKFQIIFWIEEHLVNIFDNNIWYKSITFWLCEC